MIRLRNDRGIEMIQILFLCASIFNVMAVVSLNSHYKDRFDKKESYERRKYIDTCKEIQSLRNHIERLENKINEKQGILWQ